MNHYFRLFLASLFLFAVVGKLSADQESVTKANEKTGQKIERGSEQTAPYVAVLGQIFDDVGVGNINEATEQMLLHLRSSKPKEESREKLKRLFAKVYGNAEEYDGNEVIAVRRFTKRIHIAYIVAYYENVDVVFRFEMSEFRGRWRVIDIELSNDLEEIKDLASVVTVERPTDERTQLINR